MVRLNWSEAFNQEHDVEKYRVVNTDLRSCPNSLEVGPEEDYVCSIGKSAQEYSLTFSATNCMDQEGVSNTLTFQIEGMYE